MSIVLQDAVDILNTAASAQYSKGDLADVLYADDTLLIGVSDEHLEDFVRAVYQAGRRYGMELHFGKFPVDHHIHTTHFSLCTRWHRYFFEG